MPDALDWRDPRFWQKANALWSGAPPSTFPYAGNPVGTERVSDQWLTMPDPNVSPLVGSIGAHPITAAMNQRAQEYANVLAGMDAAPIGSIRVFHGSPYAFEKFSLENVSGGTGAQTEGHGLYFAEHEAVARSYRDGLSDPTSPGHMYEADLQIDPEHMLDWDKSHSEQSSYVKDRLTRVGINAGDVTPAPYSGMPLTGGSWLRVENDPDFGTRYFMESPSGASFRINEGDVVNLIGKPGEERQGKTIYSTISGKLRSDEAASAALRDAGIPGVRYLAGKSLGEGSNHYVVFDPDTIDIIRRYGVPAMIAGGATTSAYGLGSITGNDSDSSQ